MSKRKRDSFASKRGFILACIGSAVGMGNIWMFPTRASLYGGGAFLIPYILFVFLLSSSGVISEMSFGRAMKSGPMDAAGNMTKKRFGTKKIGELLGIVPVASSLAMAIGYTVVMGWIVKYMIGTFTGMTTQGDQLEVYAERFGSMASRFGNNFWQMVALMIGIVILIFGVASGIERANKVMMPVFFFLFVGLAVYIAMQPGAGNGYQYIFSIDMEELRKPATWIFALGQAFFSLSLAGNGTLIYGSYLSDEEYIPASARFVALFDTLAAILAALVIIPAMATTGARLNEGGPGLMFIYLPNLFRSMPGGRVISIVFFVAVFFAGLSSLINLLETPIATLEEKLGIPRRSACGMIGAFTLMISILIQGIVSDWMDFVSIYACPLGAGLMGIMFVWIGSREYVETEVSKGGKKQIGKWFYPLCRYIFVPLCFLVLIIGAAMGGIG